MDSLARPRVLLADDHRMVAEGIAGLVSGRYELLDIVSDGPALVEMAIAKAPDLIVTDVSLPGCSGIEAVRRLGDAGCDIPAIFLTVHAEPALVRAAIEVGARGYVLKAEAGEELLKAMDEVLHGRVYVSSELWPWSSGQAKIPRLTPMQLRVLRMVAAGLRSREIAAALGISIRTVDSHRYSIMQALGVTSSVSLIREAERLGLLLDEGKGCLQ